MLRFASCFAALAVLPACSGGIDRSAFNLDVCQSSAQWDPLAGISPADPDAFVELAEIDDQAKSAQVLSTHGASCTSAPDPTACRAAIASVTSNSGWSTPICGGGGCRTSLQFFVTEKAGVVSVIDDDASLAALLAPIDVAADAVLVAAYADPIAYPPAAVDCTEPQALERADGSFDVFLATGDGTCTDRVEQDVAVFPNGTTALLDETTSKATQTCLSP